MIKHILTLAVLIPAFAASADVLLWQVTTAEATRCTSSSGGTADYAVFYYADASGDGVGVRLDDAYLFTPGYPTTGVAAMPEQNALEALPPGTDLSGKSFWIELYAGGSAAEENKVAWSLPIDYATMSHYLSRTLTELAPVYHPTVVPEPTGGLLVLLGLAGLALRRRRCRGGWSGLVLGRRLPYEVQM